MIEDISSKFKREEPLETFYASLFTSLASNPSSTGSAINFSSPQLAKKPAVPLRTSSSTAIPNERAKPAPIAIPSSTPVKPGQPISPRSNFSSISFTAGETSRTAPQKELPPSPTGSFLSNSGNSSPPDRPPERPPRPISPPPGGEWTNNKPAISRANTSGFLGRSKSPEGNAPNKN